MSLKGLAKGVNKLHGSISIPVGKSAYDIAVDHGFEGTEEEWLLSLKCGASIISRTVTLQASQWAQHSGDGMMYELPFEGVTADPTKTHVFYSIAPNANIEIMKAMETEANRCWVRLAIQEDGYLWFKALNGEKPTIDIDMNILVVSV